jgi:hypothetical protein
LPSFARGIRVNTVLSSQDGALPSSVLLLSTYCSVRPRLIDVQRRIRCTELSQRQAQQPLGDAKIDYILRVGIKASLDTKTTRFKTDVDNTGGALTSHCLPSTEKEPIVIPGGELKWWSERRRILASLRHIHCPYLVQSASLLPGERYSN